MESYLTTPDFEKAYRNLEKEDKEELENLYEELDKAQNEQSSPNELISDKDLQKRVAKICLILMEKTANNKTAVMEISYILTGKFINFIFPGKLGEAIDIFGQLELPEEHVEGDVEELWFRAKNLLKKYLNAYNT